MQSLFLVKTLASCIPFRLMAKDMFPRSCLISVEMFHVAFLKLAKLLSLSCQNVGNSYISGNLLSLLSHVLYNALSTLHVKGILVVNILGQCINH